MKSKINLFTGIAAVGALTLSFSALSIPASAYDKDAYGYAASHFLNEKQIPKVFAPKAKGFNVSINPVESAQVVCGYGPGGNTEVKLAKGIIESYARIRAQGRDERPLRQRDPVQEQCRRRKSFHVNE